MTFATICLIIGGACYFFEWARQRDEAREIEAWKRRIEKENGL